MVVCVFLVARWNGGNHIESNGWHRGFQSRDPEYRNHGRILPGLKNSAGIPAFPVSRMPGSMDPGRIFQSWIARFRKRVLETRPGLHHAKYDADRRYGRRDYVPVYTKGHSPHGTGTSILAVRLSYNKLYLSSQKSVDNSNIFVKSRAVYACTTAELVALQMTVEGHTSAMTIGTVGNSFHNFWRSDILAIILVTFSLTRCNVFIRT